MEQVTSKLEKPLDEQFSSDVSPACLALYKETMANSKFRPEELSKKGIKSLSHLIKN